MATCTPTALVDDAKCISQGLSDHQLLAYIAYQLAVNAGQDPTPSNLVHLGRCIAAGLGDRQIAGVIAYFQCLNAP